MIKLTVRGYVIKSLDFREIIANSCRRRETFDLSLRRGSHAVIHV